MFKLTIDIYSKLIVRNLNCCKKRKGTIKAKLIHPPTSPPRQLIYKSARYT